MKTFQNFTAIIEKEKDGFVALCPELDVASQGDSIEEAKKTCRKPLSCYWNMLQNPNCIGD